MSTRQKNEESRSYHQGGNPFKSSTAHPSLSNITHKDEEIHPDTHSDEDRATFEGFAVPQKNYFPMPNIWIDICAHIDNLAELKVVQYVLRHTWGYHEYGIPKAISVDEFMKGRKRANGSRIDEGTGLKSDRSVKDGIKAALDHGYLIRETDDSDKGRIKKLYALKMASDGGVVSTPPSDPEENRGVVSTPQTGSIYPPGVQKLPPEGQNLPPRGVKNTPRSEKDTLERHLQKDTKEKQGGEGKSDSPPQATPPPEKPPSSKSSFSELRSQWIAAYGPYGDAKWDNDALRWIADQGGSFDDIKLLYPVVADKRPEKVKNAWYKLSGLKNGQGVPVMQAAKRFSSYDDPNFRSDQNFYPVEGGSYAAV